MAAVPVGYLRAMPFHDLGDAGRLHLDPELARGWRFEFADTGDRLVGFSRLAYSDPDLARANADVLRDAILAGPSTGVSCVRTWAASYLDPPGRWRSVVEIEFAGSDAPPPVLA
jgi:hypothetical protein